MKRINMLGLIAAVLLLTLCCGCGTGAETEQGLVLACWQADEQIQTVVAQFNRDHPELPITIREYYNPNVDVDQALDKMNADLVAGREV